MGITKRRENESIMRKRRGREEFMQRENRFSMYIGLICRSFHLGYII